MSILTFRKHSWKLAHQDFIGPLPQMPPTLLEGCMDHQAALFGKRFNTDLITWLRTINRTDLIKGTSFAASVCYSQSREEIYRIHASEKTFTLSWNWRGDERGRI
jgi:hypothetical protein